MDQLFEWDEEKRNRNIEEHGVDFTRVAHIFSNPRLETIDNRKDYGEERIRAIGIHNGQIYVAIYTMRGEIIRLISAWKAGRNDREKYHTSLA